MSIKKRKYRTFKKEKGVFCIEGSWTNDHRDKTSVLKALEFLEVIEDVKTVIRQCPNLSAFKQLVNDSFQSRYSHRERSRSPPTSCARAWHIAGLSSLIGGGIR